MAVTYKLISKYTVTAATQGPSITAFTNLGDYTDLVLKISSRNNYGSLAGNILLYLNGSFSFYTNSFLQGNGSGLGGGSVARMIGDMDTASTSANIFNSIDVYIPSYKSTTLQKTFNSDSVQEELSSQAYQMQTTNLWAISGAITSIGIEDRNNASYVQGTTFYLYGIKNT